MCGRYSRDFTWEELCSYFRMFDHIGMAPPPNSFGANRNVAPTSENPILLLEDGHPQIVMARWWFHPDWAKTFESNPKYSMFNARTDRLTNSRAYQPAFERGQRCLVPMNGFYEWTGPKDDRSCWYIDTAEEGLFCMAGLFNRHEGMNDKDGFPVRYSFTLFTTEPCRSFEPYHSRMPRPMPQKDQLMWMDPSLSSEAALEHLRPLDEDQDGLHWQFTQIDRPGEQPS